MLYWGVGGAMSLVLEVLIFLFSYDSGSQNSVHGALSVSVIFTAPLDQNKHLTLPFIKYLVQNNL